MVIKNPVDIQNIDNIREGIKNSVVGLRSRIIAKDTVNDLEDQLEERARITSVIKRDGRSKMKKKTL